ncbi:AI-2E family transporter [uncultured Brachyspira sp.]|uniref:AI-2E family transporter n=1 Tax=uncultured Brachyspira sp. TaxID=221953 RepID=UPI0026141794|nr:AI-2E family transporter [uncultured Brachyspira sp.]
MKGKKNVTKWFYWFTFAVAVIAVYKTLDNFSEIANFIGTVFAVIMPFLIAIIIAYLFYTPSAKLEALFKKSRILKKKARTLSVLIVYIIAIVVVVFLIKSVIPTATNSVMDLVRSLPDYYNNVLEAYDNLDESSILKQVDVHGIIDKMKQINFMDYINFSTVGQYISGAIGVVSAVFSVFVSLIFSIYILISRRDIKTFFIKLTRAVFPENVCKNIIEYVGKTNQIFLKFIYCQILDGVIIGIIMSIILSLMDIKYGALLGGMIGLLNIIPYFGAIIGVAIACIITIFTGGLEKAILMLIVTIIMQQVDANIINPHILGEGLKTSPILIIFAVTVGGAFFGVLGMFLAVPIAAIAKIIIEDYIEFKIDDRNRKKSKNKSLEGNE